LSGTIIRGTPKTPKSQLVTPISTKLQRPDGRDSGQGLMGAAHSKWPSVGTWWASEGSLRVEEAVSDERLLV
jgi:hypothetical protein